MAFRLPRLKANLAIVNGQGKPLDYFLRFWNIDVAPLIERQEAAQEETLTDISDIQDALAAQLILIQEALELAGIAVGEGGGVTGSTTDVLDVDATWTPGPVVALTGLVAGTLTIPGSGFVFSPATTGPVGEVNGEMRLVEIVGVTETIVGGPWSYAAEGINGKTGYSVYFANPSEVNSFSAAATSTGDVSYRLDVRSDIYTEQASLKLFVRRST